MPKQRAIVGVADHCGWAVLVTVAGDDAVLDRRRVQLVEDGLPWLPHHCEAQALPPAEGVALVERVRASAERCAAAALEELAAAVPAAITGLALRPQPPLPPTIAERLTDYRARNTADGVMYRAALAEAAAERGWSVHTWERPTVFAEAARATSADLDELLAAAKRALGSPWQKDHREAMAAAIAARGPRRGRA